MSVVTPADRRAGIAWGLVGVTAFAVTLPAMRVAVASLDPVFVGLGRAVVAAALAAIALAVTRTPWPARSLWPRLAVVALGVVVGFPLLTAWAMRYVPSSHGAVVVGLLPLATAVAGAWLAHERPSARFWLCAVAGSAVVVGFALWQGSGALHVADLLLIGAVAAAAIGYAEGARLTRLLGGWQVISWALVLSAPILVVPTWLAAEGAASAPWQAWLAFLYVAVVSMYLGFFAWYRALAQGGIAAVGQVQLLQPFLTFAFAALFLGERLEASMLVAAALVVAIIALGRRG
ncbi:MAG: DMT family transporter [Betaproteobacteria bacterium]|jgi:drug/metabolite transporter (DMT)-like permease|nr:DMT family transporter [Betaproteobacteria bacterium]